MAAIERDPRAYELMTIFLPDMPEEDNQAQLDRVAGYITSAGGAIKETLTDSPWGRRRLAYTVRFNSVDFRDGFYTVYHFDAVPSAISNIERDLKLDTSTMRYLLVHDDPKVGERFPAQDGEGTAQGDAPETTDQPRVAASETEPAGRSATVETAAEEEPAETLTEDAVSAEDQPVTEEAPELLDADSAQVPVSRVASSQSEGDDETDSADETSTADTVDAAGSTGEDAVTPDEAPTSSTEENTESTDDEAKKE